MPRGKPGTGPWAGQHATEERVQWKRDWQRDNPPQNLDKDIVAWARVQAAIEQTSVKRLIEEILVLHLTEAGTPKPLTDKD